jgi:hypothetical protein
VRFDFVPEDKTGRRARLAQRIPARNVGRILEAGKSACAKLSMKFFRPDHDSLAPNAHLRYKSDS